MKKNLQIILCLMVLPFLVIAQSVPEGFNYQAVVRDAAGNIKKDATVELKFVLLPSQFSSKAAWAETHTVKTDAFGTCNLVIGSGKRISGTAATFGKVDFSASSYWLKVELKDNGQYIDLGGAQKLLSVPYARVAGKVVADVPSIPVGAIMPFAGSLDKIPAGWLLCDGAAISRSTYQPLFNTIQTNWGVGYNATTFNLPDLRGMFLRGVDAGAGKDPDAETRINEKGGNIGNNVGSNQGEEFKGHNHGGGNHPHRFEGASTIDTWGSNIVVGGNAIGPKTTPESGVIIATEGGKETRPKNAYVYYIIKY